MKLPPSFDSGGCILRKRHAFSLQFSFPVWQLTERQTILFPESARGTYILILRLPAPAALTVGRLGSFPFAAGWYAYVGSAFGAGGLRGRLKHHLGREHGLHWHIDYLAQAATIEEIWYIASETGYEHHWANLLTALPDASLPVNRFGASDCKCPSHLFHFSARPSFDQFRALTPEQDDIRCWDVTLSN